MSMQICHDTASSYLLFPFILSLEGDSQPGLGASDVRPKSKRFPLETLSVREVQRQWPIEAKLVLFV